MINSAIYTGDTFEIHTSAYVELEVALSLYLKKSKERITKKFCDYISALECAVELLYNFFHDDNGYVQKLTKSQREIARDSIGQFLTLCGCRKKFDFDYCSYDEISEWNHVLRERAIKNADVLSMACLNVTRLGNLEGPKNALQSVTDDTCIKELCNKLLTVRIGDKFLNVFKEFVSDFDSFIAKNAAPPPAPKEKPKLDKATLGLMQEILGFLHSHIADGTAKAEEEQISIFLEEHDARVVWSNEDDSHSNDHFFVSYDSALTEAKDIRPCIICDNFTLRGSRILPSAN